MLPAAPWIERLARVGFAAKAVLYTMVGVLALQAALGNGGDTTGSQGALQKFVAQPFGAVALVVIAAGLFGYAAWRVTEAALDCCCTVVVSLEDAWRDEHFRARGLFAVDAAAGDARIPAVVVPIVPGFREASAKVRPMAKSGEHTRAVLGSQIRDP